MHSEQSYSPRIVFLGSAPLALPVLDALARTQQVVGLVTQPDRPAGRGRRLERGRVAARGDDMGLPVLQPLTFRDRQTFDEIRQLEPEVLVVASYGRLLPESVLRLPTHGALNVHPSLLPRHRGPSPVAWAILEGDAITGVTIMEMVAQMDAGPIVAQQEVGIAESDTTGSLTHRLAHEGADLIVESIQPWLEGTIKAVPQDESTATYSRLLTKEAGRIDWCKPAAQLGREVRAFNPWPVSYTTWQGKALRIWSAKQLDEADGSQAETGLVTAPDPRSVTVQTGQGLLLLEEVQPAGGRRMPAADFVKGHPDIIGARLRTGE